ncbi:hypothetical protein BBF96_13255 [Anoxybacter fermentans]|uniref:Radical SAM core domain-containing protein n=1 Tax=Anoxybacter fermentans TaxID=1323375 RepID=A0A3Q9HS31_9FIRM|nr:radical SAM protein [Anoxybacter fermentans]AZR74283.1 hypothetical protein BBF96_13255 [Anoxybacter fermentans]
MVTPDKRLILNKYPLKELFVEITDKCNLLCKHCSTEAGPTGEQQLNFKKIVEIIDEAYNLGVRYFCISGGEPLLHPDVFEMIEYAKKRGMKKVTLYSCGYITGNLQKNKTLLERLASSKLDRIIFSLHSSDPMIHDQITGIKGSYEFAIKAIQYAVTKKMKVEVHCVPMSYNFKTIPSLLRLCEKLGVEQLSLLRLVKQGRCMDNPDLVMSKRQLNVFREIINKLKNGNYKTRLRLGAPFNCLFLDRYTKCTAALCKILISADGSLFPCEAFKTSARPAPNIYKMSLFEYWSKDPLLWKLREDRQKITKACKDCESLEKCRGGCPGQRYLIDKNFTKKDPLCYWKVNGVEKVV